MVLMLVAGKKKEQKKFVGESKIPSEVDYN